MWHREGAGGKGPATMKKRTFFETYFREARGGPEGLVAGTLKKLLIFFATSLNIFEYIYIHFFIYKALDITMIFIS